MHRKFLFLLVTILLSGYSFLHAQGKYLETIKVTDSIYVFKPKIDWLHGNGVAIIGPEGVFFIDTYIQTNYAEEAIQTLKKITKLPVTYVLNTHWHYDHVMGNAIFKKAYPNCKIIMQDSTYAYMISKVIPKIATTKQDTKDDIAQLTKEISEGKMSNGNTLTEKMKSFWEWQLREAQDYGRSFKENRMVNADITFSDSMTFHWGSLTLQLLHASENGHSKGDAILWIPEKKLVVTGDIIVGPTPYATNPNVPGLIKSIKNILDMQPAIIIPGHGPVAYDLNYATLVHKAFVAYVTAAEKAADDNIPPREAVTKINFPEIDVQFTGEDEVKKWAYQSFFTRNILVHTYRRKGKMK
jgi:cyclase